MHLKTATNIAIITGRDQKKSPQDIKTATMIIPNIYVTPQYVFVSEFKVDDKVVVCVVNTGMIRDILL